MDPDVVLASAREAFKGNNVARAAELFEAMDTWISSGGFMPKDWRDAQEAIR